MLTISSVERRQATRRCEKIDFCVLRLLKNQQLTGAEIAIFQFFHSFPFPTCEFSPLDRLREDGRVLQQNKAELIGLYVIGHSGAKKQEYKAFDVVKLLCIVWRYDYDFMKLPGTGLTFNSENEEEFNGEIAPGNKKEAKAPPGQHRHSDQQGWRSPAGCRESKRD